MMAATAMSAVAATETAVPTQGLNVNRYFVEQSAAMDQETMKAWFDEQVARAEARAEAARKAMGVWMPEAPKAPDLAAMKDMDRKQIKALMQEQFEFANALAEKQLAALKASMPKMPVPAGFEDLEAIDFSGMSADEAKARAEEMRNAIVAMPTVGMLGDRSNPDTRVDYWDNNLISRYVWKNQSPVLMT